MVPVGVSCWGKSVGFGGGCVVLVWDWFNVVGGGGVVKSNVLESQIASLPVDWHEKKN